MLEVYVNPKRWYVGRSGGSIFRIVADFSPYKSRESNSTNKHSSRNSKSLKTHKLEL